MYYLKIKDNRFTLIKTYFLCPKIGVHYTVDVYRIASKGFTNFTALSPVINYENKNLGTDLGTSVKNTVIKQLQAALISSGMPAADAMATATQIGTAVGDAYTQGGNAFSEQIAPLSSIFGAVQTDGVPNDEMVHTAVGTRTFGKMAYWGTDISLGYQINTNFSVIGNLSMLSKVHFTEKDLGEAEGSGLTYDLNVPKNKFRLGAVYSPAFGWRGNLSFQHDDSFYSNFGQYAGNTDKKNLVDFGVGYKLKSGLSFDITATNLFNTKYRAFQNMPQIGRRAIAKLTYTFGEK